MTSETEVVVMDKPKQSFKLECEICWERFSIKRRSRQPHVGGSCGHSFCFRCAAQLRRKRKCGRCRATFKPVKNFALIECMEKMDEMRNALRGKNKKLKEKMKEAEVEMEDESSEESEPESVESEVEEIPIAQPQMNPQAVEFQQIYDFLNPPRDRLDNNFLADIPDLQDDDEDFLGVPNQQNLAPRIPPLRIRFGNEPPAWGRMHPYPAPPRHHFPPHQNPVALGPYGNRGPIPMPGGPYGNGELFNAFPQMQQGGLQFPGPQVNFAQLRQQAQDAAQQAQEAARHAREAARLQVVDYIQRQQQHQRTFMDFAEIAERGAEQRVNNLNDQQAHRLPRQIPLDNLRQRDLPRNQQDNRMNFHDFVQRRIEERERNLLNLNNQQAPPPPPLPPHQGPNGSQQPGELPGINNNDNFFNNGPVYDGF